MAGSHQFLGWLACLLYIGVAFACLGAMRVSDRPDDRRRWVFFAAFFVFLALLRGSGLEAAVTEGLRHHLQAEGTYENRREMQRPLAALAVIAISAALYLFYLKRPLGQGRMRDWSRFWAMVGVTLMLGVIAMRLISFHELDRLLYGVRMNWVLDIGSSVIVALAAVRFRRISMAMQQDADRPVIQEARRPK